MSELEDKVRMLLGVKPYDEDTNYCKNDAYFAKYLRDRYGSKAVDEMIAQVRSRG